MWHKEHQLIKSALARRPLLITRVLNANLAIPNTNKPMRGKLQDWSCMPMLVQVLPLGGTDHDIHCLVGVGEHSLYYMYVRSHVFAMLWIHVAPLCQNVYNNASVRIVSNHSDHPCFHSFTKNIMCEYVWTDNGHGFQKSFWFPQNAGTYRKVEK